MSETFLKDKVTLHCGDCLTVLPTLAADSVDACVCDPPYNLISINKRFGQDGSAAAQYGTDGRFQRLSGGFMNAKWDGTGIAFRPEVWREVYRVLKPGAHLLAFGGTRTQHRMVCAIEDAGFEIRDTILYLFATGFPKSHDVSKGIDRRKDWTALPKLQQTIKIARTELGISQSEAARRMGLIAPNEDLGGGGFMWFETGMRMPTREQWPQLKAALDLDDDFDLCFAEAEREITGVVEEWGDRSNYQITSKDGFRRDRPATDAARQWQGFGTALKPACEMICLARKPLSESTVAQNVLRWGTGAINIDGCRVDSKPRTTHAAGNIRTVQDNPYLGTKSADHRQDEELLEVGHLRAGPNGRWPANLILSSDDAEVLAGFPDTCASPPIGSMGGGSNKHSIFGDFAGERHGNGFGDSGSAARFFYQVEKDTLCGLCCLPYDSYSDSISSCNANNVESNSSTESTQGGAFVHSDVAGSQAPGSADKKRQPSGHANSAVFSSPQCHPPEVTIVQENVQPSDELKIAQNVRSAASLCNLCAIGIARALVALRQARSVASVPFKDFIEGRNAQILIQHLALYAEGRESTDIILTTESLKQLFGSVFHAIEKNTLARVENQSQAPEKLKRFWYDSKADSDDRLGSRHPTIKPLSLMQYLCRLVCPKGGQILDPFAGTGTTGEAAFREGMRAVLIEREKEYQDDIRRRMALAWSGPDERAREASKARMSGKPRDDGPLFGGKSEWDDMWSRPFDYPERI